jgi:dihydrolipoamide dehydrogenase
MERSFKKAGINVMTNASVTAVDTSGKLCKVTVEGLKGQQVIESEIVLSAVGVTPNIEGIGLEELGVTVEKGKVKVDDFYRTNVEGIYAIGDIVHGPALAHVASAEGYNLCRENCSRLDAHPVDYKK